MFNVVGLGVVGELGECGVGVNDGVCFICSFVDDEGLGGFGCDVGYECVEISCVVGDGL